MAKQKKVYVVCGPHKIELDCPKKEEAELTRKLKLLTWGNGKDLCILSCDKNGCRAARLKARNDDNISQEYRKKYFTNGGIELISQDKISSFMANNSEGCYCSPESGFITVNFVSKGLKIMIRW